MANTRTRDLADEQEVYSEDLILSVDDATFDTKKKTTIRILAPLSKPGTVEKPHLTEATSINPETFYLRGNLSGNERCALAKYLLYYTYLDNYSSLDTSSLFSFYHVGTAKNVKISYTALLNSIVNSATFISEIDDLRPPVEDLTPISSGSIESDSLFRFRQDSNSTEYSLTWAGLLSKIVAHATFIAGVKAAMDNSVILQENCHIDTTNTCDILITRIGNIVNVMMIDLKATAADYLTDYVIPSGYRPYSTCRSTGGELGGSDPTNGTWFSVTKVTGVIYVNIHNIGDPSPSLTYQIATS